LASSSAFTPRKRVEVDVSAIRANTSALVQHVGSGVQVMAMVKSNGYGHGIRLAAEAAIDGGARWLGVASSTEAFEVSTFRVPVLIVGRCDPGSHDALIDAGIETTVYDDEGVDTTAGAAARVGRRARVHVKVDTGMGRLGVSPDGLAELLRTLAKYSADVEVVGVFTNFADSDAPDLSFTDQQHDCFVAAVDEVRAAAPDALAHCSNSGAILRAPHMHHDLVRPGISLYGYAPDTAAEVVDLRLAMTMIAPVTQVKTVQAGIPVGYGRTWIASEPTRVATVAAGYADGVLRAQSNTGFVLVAGHRCPIVGRVSMDQLCVDVSGVDTEVRPGDDVALFGEQAGARLGADEVGGYAGTIEREILTAVADRIPRIVVSP
jgi:alanine racemase